MDKFRCYTESREDYLKTIERIKSDKRIENIVLSHAYEPWNKDRVSGREQIYSCLEDCIECISEKQ